MRWKLELLNCAIFGWNCDWIHQFWQNDNGKLLSEYAPVQSINRPVRMINDDCVVISNKTKWSYLQKSGKVHLTLSKNMCDKSFVNCLPIVRWLARSNSKCGAWKMFWRTNIMWSKQKKNTKKKSKCVERFFRRKMCWLMFWLPNFVYLSKWQRKNQQNED